MKYFIITIEYLFISYLIMVIIIMAYLKNCIYVILFFKYRTKKLLRNFEILFFENGIRIENIANQKNVNYKTDEIYITISKNIIEINNIVWIIKERLSEEELEKIYILCNEKIGFLRKVEE